MKRLLIIFITFSLLVFSGCERAAADSKGGQTAGRTDHTADAENVSADRDADGAPTETADKKHSSEGKNVSGSQEADKSSEAQIDPSSLPNTMFYWWFKRNENHAAPEAQQEIDLTKYDAWYVKTEVKDGEKPVFLTFDCGYENGYTPGILDVLQKHRAPAAFFVCKHFIEDQPDLIRRMKEEGHVVGNHTANHICMPENDDRTVREEIAENADYMKEATGYEMDPFFRPPKGEYSERTLQITKNMGYTTIFWSLAYVDYDINSQPGADYVINQFDQYIHPGAIPLIHNISESNAQALDTVLTNLENAGYTFCSLYELSDTAATGNSGSSD